MYKDHPRLGSQPKLTGDWDDVLRIKYAGEILPILSYGATMWIECLQRKHNITNLRRVRRLINIKRARACRTSHHMNLCVLTGITPIQIELRSQANCYYITRGNIQIIQRMDPTFKSNRFKGKVREKRIYEPGLHKWQQKSKQSSFRNWYNYEHLMLQLRYKVAERCSNKMYSHFAHLCLTLEAPRRSIWPLLTFDSLLFWIHVLF